VIANQRVGGTATQALSFTNLAAADGYSEGLSASITTSGSATAGGFLNRLAAGASSNAMTVGVNTSSAGAKSGTATIALSSDGTGTSDLGIFALGAQTVNVSGNVYRLATPAVITTPIVLAARVGDAAPSRFIDVINNAPDAYTERLNASIGSVPAGFEGSGTVTGLLANASTRALGVSLSTATAGSYAGSASVALVSSGTGTTNAPDQALGSVNVGLTGRVYAPAVARVSPISIDFGIARVGDTVASRAVAVSNAATGGLTDTLQASIGSAAAPFTTSGSVSGLTVGSTSGAALTVQLSTAAAGVFSGQATLSLASHNPDMADLNLAPATVTLKGQVNQIAVVALSRAGGSGSFSQAGSVYTLDFGTLNQGDAGASSALLLANTAQGVADALAGSWDLTGSSTGAFSLAGFNSFSGLTAGSILGGPSIGFSTASAGSFDQVVVLHARSTNGSGPDLALADVTLHLQGSVVAVPEPGTYALMAGGLLALWLRRARQRGLRAA
jgi:hypothetical protein